MDLPPEGLDLRRCLAAGQVFRWNARPDGRWEGVDGDAWFRFGIDGDRLSVESSADEAHVRRLFRYQDDPRLIRQDLLRRFPELELALPPNTGLRLLAQGNPVEVLFTFLCTSNNHIARITTMVNTLTAYGEPIGEGFRAFPTLERIANISEAELRAQGFGYRAAFLPTAAKRALAEGGTRWLADLANGTYQEAHHALRTLPGVGPKVADCVALFGLHHGEAVPIDVHVYRAVVEWFFPELQDKALTELRYRRIGDRFREMFDNRAGWVQQMLFTEKVTNSRFAPERPKK